jgi:hypothetical protein
MGPALATVGLWGKRRVARTGPSVGEQAERTCAWARTANARAHVRPQSPPTCSKLSIQARVGTMHS